MQQQTCNTLPKQHVGLSENSVPLNWLVNQHFSLFNWIFGGYTPFSSNDFFQSGCLADRWSTPEVGC